MSCLRGCLQTGACTESGTPAGARIGKGFRFYSHLLDFDEFIGDNWVILFSHPEDYTPVCTTELGAFAKLQPEFTKRGVKLIGLSANTIESHEGWIKDIGEVTGGNVEFPIIGDKQRQVSLLYDM